MAEPFPPTIEDCFLLGNFSYQDEPNAIRTEIDAGPAKMRRRFTDQITSVSGGITVDHDQLQDFLYFYRTTLLAGVLTFLFLDPVTGVEQEYRFVQPPGITPVTDKQWSVSMILEILP